MILVYLDRCYSFTIVVFIREASSSAEAQACERKRDRLWIWFPVKEMQYSIIHFFALVSRQKRGVQIRHSTRNVYRIWWKMENGYLNTRSRTRSTLLCAIKFLSNYIILKKSDKNIILICNGIIVYLIVKLITQYIIYLVMLGFVYFLFARPI